MCSYMSSVGFLSFHCLLNWAMFEHILEVQKIGRPIFVLILSKSVKGFSKANPPLFTVIGSASDQSTNQYQSILLFKPQCTISLKFPLEKAANTTKSWLSNYRKMLGLFDRTPVQLGEFVEPPSSGHQVFLLQFSAALLSAYVLLLHP